MRTPFFVGRHSVFGEIGGGFVTVDWWSTLARFDGRQPCCRRESRQKRSLKKMLSFFNRRFPIVITQLTGSSRLRRKVAKEHKAWSLCAFFVSFVPQ